MTKDSICLDLFDQSLKESNSWIKNISEEMHWRDPRESYEALKTVLHAIRDALPSEQALRFGEKLTFLLKGIYYEGWHPQLSHPEKPVHENSGELIQQRYPEKAEEVTGCVFRVMAKRLKDEELGDVAELLPPELKGIWRQSILHQWVA